MHIFLGADHRGFRAKEKLRQWLSSEGHEVVDMGNRRYDPEDDFPDFALKVAERVAKEEGVGILLCGSGGMALAANKVRGVRAVEASDEERAAHAKSHDHANVLTLPVDVLDSSEVTSIVGAWLGASRATDTKYLRRLKKIDAIERKYFKDE